MTSEKRAMKTSLDPVNCYLILLLFSSHLLLFLEKTMPKLSQTEGTYPLNLSFADKSPVCSVRIYF